mmetsp:Transcript_14267/g.25501  ORF Transcript_14267/g.25501 Transcript_14267/m.25501 type:complete len:363 (+) Transcript_14267:51-1139(+)
MDESHDASLHGLVIKRNIDQDFVVLSDEVLGTGGYGCVVKAICKKTGKEFAVKSVKKSANASKMRKLRREISHMSRLKHENVVELHSCYEDAQHVHIVMELCHGPNLNTFAKERCKEGTTFFSEAEVKILARDMLKSLTACHDRGIIHRDIKLENFVFGESTKGGKTRVLKLIDFGLSASLRQDGRALSTRCGSTMFCAPELLAKKYSKEIDLWSLGVVLYILLTGRAPFDGNSEEEILSNIRKSELDLQDKRWMALSASARHLLSFLLAKDPTQRLSAHEALAHVWFEEAVPLTVPNVKEERPFQTESSEYVCLLLVTAATWTATMLLNGARPPIVRRHTAAAPCRTLPLIRHDTPQMLAG